MWEAIVDYEFMHESGACIIVMHPKDGRTAHHAFRNIELCRFLREPEGACTHSRESNLALKTRPWYLRKGHIWHTEPVVLE